MFSAQSSLPGPLSDPIGPRPPNPEPHTHPVANQKSSRKRKKQQPRQPPPAKNCNGSSQARMIRNIPGADGFHHPLPGAGLRSTIDILEEAANRTTSLDHPLDTNRRQANSNIPSTEPCPPNHSGPLEGLHEALNALAPKRNGKRFRTREEDGRSRQSQPIGTQKAVRPPNKWNRFLQQLSARKKFRGVGKGVAGHRLGMREVSLLYKRYNTRKQPPRTSGLPTTNPASRSPSPEPELTPSKLALDDDLDVEEALNPQSNPPLSSQLRGPVSLSKAESRVEAFLANWVNQANSIAQTCNCEMIVFAVSTHLGRHSFQLTKSTHCALPFVELADEVDQPTTYPARFQASLVGTSALDLAKHNKPARRVRAPRPNVTKRMIQFVGKYPPASCYKLVTDPRLRTPIKMFTSRPSRWLKVQYIQTLNLDLDDGYIDIIPLESTVPVSSTDTPIPDPSLQRSMPPIEDS
ncbi:hypothetical protein PtA15_18A169 [Puccinia triticina]|uniref:Uncharacterized protein n=1 Tax=Puccinia triticina TaxID=208348 RepID=A0ABY7D621_9BASI|nr:uncharacterized protein PtA15_18A169 [Puccinia triticina]WAQ93111.1 hypothetical protein PtA15_18A169 [Puccinia triticina]